jgi:hypothetical protein
MADRKDQHGIPGFLEAVEGHIPGTPSGYHQLPQAIFHGPADQRMPPQEFDGFLDQSDRLGGGGRIGLDQEVGQPFEIGEALVPNSSALTKTALSASRTCCRLSAP